MSKLLISKNTEAKVVASVWEMGAESLDPDSYESLEKVLKNYAGLEVLKINQLV